MILSCYSGGLGGVESLGVYGVFGDSGGHGGTTSEAAVPAPALAALSVLKSGDMGQCPHKSPSPCNTYVIPMSLYKCMSSFVTKTRTNTHTHTNARTHIHTHASEQDFDLCTTYTKHCMRRGRVIVINAHLAADGRVSGVACVKTPHR